VSLEAVHADPERFPDVIACGTLRTGLACLPFRMQFPTPRSVP
jgi:hypothetical protein